MVVYEFSRNTSSGAAMGCAMACAGCAMHKGPVVRQPLWAAYSGISFLLTDTECSQINWNLRFSTRTHLTVVSALKKAEWPNCRLFYVKVYLFFCLKFYARQWSIGYLYFLLAKKQPFFFAVTNTKACTELTVALHTSSTIVGDRAVKVDD